MEKPIKFLLPPPSFDKKPNGMKKAKPHFLTPSGMTLLPREKQPPPMYGKRGATVPAKYLNPSVSPEPVPETEKQYCEPCELELQSQEDFRRHRAQHEKCPVAGCQYKGHPTVMDKHINALHSSGLFDKFKKLNSPEEISAWREERRKRFPTVANVLLKQKAQEQRQKRGERLEAKRNRFGKLEDRKRAQPNALDAKTNEDVPSTANKNQNRNQRNKNRNKNNRKRQNDRMDCKTTQDSCVEKAKPVPAEIEELPWHGLTAFRGTLQIKDYKHVSRKPKQQNALVCLVGMYGSDDDTEDEHESDENEDTCEAIEDSKKENTTLSSIETNMDKSQENVQCDKNSRNLASDEDNIKDDIMLDVDHKESVESTKEDCDTSPTANIANRNLTESVNLSDTKTDLPENANVNGIMSTSNNSVRNSSDEAPEEAPIQRTIPEYKLNKEKLLPNPTPSDLKSKELPQKQQHKPTENYKVRKFLKRTSGLDYRKLKMRKQNTMLEKLLETDIRHERNVLLQCVRYVCENNFFGVGGPDVIN